MSPACHRPVFFGSVLDDPTLVRRLVEANGPYLPVQRYFHNDAEYRASSAPGSPGEPMIVAPNFRGDWAYDVPLVAGVEPILHHEGFRRTAAEMFGSACVEPFSVYANITWQLPFDEGGGHVDVFERFYADLERRGVAFARSPDPVADPALVDVLAATYVRAPSVFEARVA